MGAHKGMTKNGVSTPCDAPITLDAVQAAFAESLLPPQPPTYAFHPDVQKDDHPLHELFVGMLNNTVCNTTAAYTTLMEPVAPLTVATLMEMYGQIEKLAQKVEDARLNLRSNLHVFFGAPWEVVRAASMLAYTNPLDIHPAEYKRAQNLILAYLEDLSNASTR
jgi:hypothetical protein